MFCASLLLLLLVLLCVTYLYRRGPPRPPFPRYSTRALEGSSIAMEGFTFSTFFPCRLSRVELRLPTLPTTEALSALEFFLLFFAFFCFFLLQI